jgi:16S rRNA (guanine966-N2)-methyltransferase
MRVIGGSAKGIQLQPVPGHGTRPILDRVKEALFNIIGGEVVGAQILDLFAGTGSVGIEALSRGAERAVFVEKRDRAVATIWENLRRTGLQARASVVRADVFKYLSGDPNPFDLLYIAPPQYQNLWSKTILALDANPHWLAPGGVAVVQIFPKEWGPLEFASLRLADERRYGSTLLCFFERQA